MDPQVEGVRQPKAFPAMAAGNLGEAALHSSQIHGFTTGKLRDPHLKVLLAIGQLNGHRRGERSARVKTCLNGAPGVHAELWREAWMRIPGLAP